MWIGGAMMALYLWGVISNFYSIGKCEGSHGGVGHKCGGLVALLCLFV